MFARASSRPHLVLAALAGLLITAFAVGGGGSRFGIANLLVQLVALGVLAAFPRSVWQFFQSAPLVLRLLVGAAILLPLLQLWPLPAAMWRSLPGRDLSEAAFDIAGLDGAMPLSLYPQRTALAASALLTPLAVVAMGWTIPRHHLLNLAWLIVALGLVTLVIGVAQLADTTGALEFWPEGISLGVLLGTFANRNTTGLFLVGALGFALLLPLPRRPGSEALIRLSSASLLMTAIILTQSRTALVLAAIPLLLGLLRWAFTLASSAGLGSPRRAGVIVAAVLGVALVGGAGVIASAPGRLAETLQRFEGRENDTRRYIWEDGAYAAGRYWPVGAGIGTFDEVFQVDEAVENLSSGRRAGRAHNDILEAIIEAGAFGLGLIALWLCYLGWLSWQARRTSDRWAAWAASSFLLAIALQSLTDYPLRNQTMLAMAAFALVLLARLASTPQSEAGT